MSWPQVNTQNTYNGWGGQNNSTYNPNTDNDQNGGGGGYVYERSGNNSGQNQSQEQSSGTNGTNGTYGQGGTAGQNQPATDASTKPTNPQKSLAEMQQQALQSYMGNSANVVDQTGADINPDAPNYYKMKFKHHKNFNNNNPNQNFSSIPASARYKHYNNRGFRPGHLGPGGGSSRYSLSYNRNNQGNSNTSSTHHGGGGANTQNNAQTTNGADAYAMAQATRQAAELANTSVAQLTGAAGPARHNNSYHNHRNHNQGGYQNNHSNNRHQINHLANSQTPTQVQSVNLARQQANIQMSQLTRPQAPPMPRTNEEKNDWSDSDDEQEKRNKQIRERAAAQQTLAAANALQSLQGQAYLTKNAQSHVAVTAQVNAHTNNYQNQTNETQITNDTNNLHLTPTHTSRHRQGSTRSMTDRWSVNKTPTSTNNLITQHFKTGPGTQVELTTHIIYERWLDFDLYPLTNYNFGTKDAVEDDLLVDVNDPAQSSSESQPTSVSSTNLKKLQEDYKKSGMRKTVEACLIVHEHNLPHLLLLQKGKSTVFRLPGGKLENMEDSQEGLRRHLKKILGKANIKTSSRDDPAQRGIDKDDWIIKDVLGQWYRPNFDHKLYCYKPAHVTKPKENLKLYLIQLPPKALFAVPRNYKLVAAPLHEVYNNSEIYGNVISMIPHMISRFNLMYKKDA